MAKAKFFGHNPPFIGGPQNIMSRQEDERLIKNDILQLLLTVPGERVMRPTFGVQLRSFVFEQSTEADLAALQTEIMQKLDAFEPRVDVNSVILTPDEGKNGLNVRIVVRLKSDPAKEISIEQFVAGGA